MPRTREDMLDLVERQKEKRRKLGYTGGGMREMPVGEAVYVMPRQEIYDWYERKRNDPWQLSEMPVTPIALALISGSRYDFMSKVLAREHESELIFRRLTTAIDEIDNHRVVWGELENPALGGRYKGAGIGRTEIVHLPMIVKQTHIPRVAPRSEWNIFVKCAGCGSRKWLPIESDGKSYVACYTCLPPSQYPSLGYAAMKAPLIREFVRSRHG